MNKIIDTLIKKHHVPLKSIGNSMFPLLRENDIVIYKKISFPKIKINDLLIIKKNKKLLSHRIIYKTNQYIITKGDNSLLNDGKIFPRQIIGKIIKVKRNGKIFNPEDFYLIQSFLYFKEIIKIKKIFDFQKIDYVFLKGIPINLYYENTPPRRIYADCDLLIKKNDISKAEKILSKNGYQKGDPNLSKTHKKIKNKEVERPYIKDIDGFTIVFDLHLEPVFMMTQLGRLEGLYPQKYIDQFTEELLQTKRKVKINNELFFILDTKYLILYLALHLFHHNLHGAFRYDFLDKVWRKSKLDSVLINQLIKIIKNYRFQNFIYPVFALLKKQYKTPLSSNWLNAIKPTNLIAYFINKKLVKNINVFDNEPRVQGGILRFKNIFFLSPEPLWRRILVFLNFQVLHSISWVVFKKFKKN